MTAMSNYDEKRIGVWENCSNVSNSVLTDEGTSSKERSITTLVLDQNSSGVLLRYMVSLYIKLEAQTIPNKCAAMQCKMQCRCMMP